VSADSSSMKRRPTRARTGYRSCGLASDIPDPFAVNPIRRSFALVAICGLVVGISIAIGGSVAMSVMLTVGWLAVTGIVMGVPILVLSLAEEGWRRLRRRFQPSLEELGLSPRLLHILARHGYDAIEDVDRAADDSLLLMSNMDARGLREVRRAISLWKYRRWQERGFPAGGYE